VSTRHGVRARTVAVRGTARSRAISPKKSPSCSSPTATSYPSAVVLTTAVLRTSR
jgi:hypothetical protein